MKVVFMGTPAFAVPALVALLKLHDVAAVLTQPDRPAGRGNKIVFSPVKEAALAAGVEVLQPETLFIKKKNKDDIPCFEADAGDAGTCFRHHSPREVRDRLKSLGADIFIVAAYGLMLPKAVLEMPRLGCVNIHASLLPKYRGASPIHAAILNGEAVTGITIMHMDEGIDTGDMILQKSMAIAPDEHFPSVHDRMAALGGETIIEALAAVESNTALRIKQDDSLASYAPMIGKTDGLIDWNQSASQIINRIRAFDPWPGAYTMYEQNSLKIWRAERSLISGDSTKINNRKPGTIFSADNRGLTVLCGDGALLLTELQGPNAKRMPAGDYLRGRTIKTGTIL
ncbi:MAG: methionyl-tRNA formyltransferase [Defluviitaleaceae bacterium]|nr:methionyl-tRNA formyltransferase [Defluviitaleaceae bacterium]